MDAEATPIADGRRREHLPEEDAAIAKMYRAGVSTAEIERQFRCGRNFMVEALHSEGVAMRPSRRAAESQFDDVIGRMRRGSFSLESIAATIGRPMSFVRGRLAVLADEGAVPVTLHNARLIAENGTLVLPTPAPRIIETPPPRKCQWPAWGHHDRPSHCYCNQAVTPGKPYCADHAARAYTTIPSQPFVTRPPNKSQPKPPSLPAEAAAAKKGGPGRRKVHADRQPAPLECCITDTEREIAADWNSGLTASEIATKQQKAEGTIAALISRIRARKPDAEPKRRGNPMFGSGEARMPIPIPFAATAQLAAILRHYNDGKTYQAIADAVGLNKSQVAGLINRARPRSGEQAAA